MNNRDPAQPVDLVVVLLRAMIRSHLAAAEAYQAALAEAGAAGACSTVPLPSPVSFTRGQLAAHLGVLPAQVDRARRNGMPVSHRVGGHPRFDPVACRAWLAAQDAQPPRAATSQTEEPVSGVRRVRRRRRAG